MSARHFHLLVAATLVTVGPACLTRSTGAPGDTDSERLARYGDEYWQLFLRQSPVWATYLGERRFDNLLPDLSEAEEERLSKERAALAAALARLDPKALSAKERVSLQTLSTMLAQERAREVCQDTTWAVSPLDGVQVTLGQLPRLHSISRPEHAKSMEIRYLSSGTLMDQQVAALRRGLAEGRIAARTSVERAIDQLGRMTEAPPERSPLVTEVALPTPWRDEERQATLAGLAQAVSGTVYPALTRYREFLTTEYLPRTRDALGVGANTDGEACYLARVRAFSGSDRSPREIHQVGLAEMKSLKEKMQALAVARIGKPDVDALKAALQADPTLRLTSREALLDYNRQVIARAQAAMPRAFGRLPRLPVEVKPIEAFREKDAAAGYYYSGSESENRPGYYYLNTSNPQTRPLFTQESLAFHEAVPGHHLQRALAQEVEGLPRFRREISSSAFTEGWAHYAELLADELGLYSGDAARFGMLSDQALRAGRLVVDTGLHALGWSRQQAIDYLLENTAEHPDEVAREVDRYIAWPGQALAYKMGQLAILDQRAKWKEALGDRFDLRVFHDTLLASGSRPIPVMVQEMEAALASQREGSR